MIDGIRITEEAKENWGKITVEPLPQGFGVTLGNALRRVLLSSLEGVAITQVKIAGVVHEYSTIKGVKEDVVKILLNLKKVRLKIENDEKTVKLSLDEKGPKIVKAGDIKVPQGVVIVDPEVVITTLADAKTKLEMDMVAEKGTGYFPVENRKNVGIGNIPLDADFSPVRRVNYRVEATRVGQMTNFDKLTLEVLTDASIPPFEATKEAARILGEYFNYFLEPIKEIKKEEKPKRVERFDENASIEELDLPTRVVNSLKNGGIKILGDIVKADKKELLKFKNMGAKSLEQIQEKLKEKGYEF